MLRILAPTVASTNSGKTSPETAASTGGKKGRGKSASKNTKVPDGKCLKN